MTHWRWVTKLKVCEEGSDYISNLNTSNIWTDYVDALLRGNRQQSEIISIYKNKLWEVS